MDKAKDAEGKLTKTFKRIGTTIAAFFAVDKIVDFGKACTQTYASIAAEESAFAQIMGELQPTSRMTETEKVIQQATIVWDSGSAMFPESSLSGEMWAGIERRAAGHAILL